MSATRHRKYAPPPIAEAPPELAALIEVAAGPSSRGQQRALMDINRWLVNNRIRKYTLIVSGPWIMGTAEGCPRIGRRWEPLPREGGSDSK
jgi:hypothetical protein